MAQVPDSVYLFSSRWASTEARRSLLSMLAEGRAGPGGHPEGTALSGLADHDGETAEDDDSAVRGRSPRRAAIMFPMRTVGEPFTIVSGGPTQTACRRRVRREHR